MSYFDEYDSDSDEDIFSDPVTLPIGSPTGIEENKALVNSKETDATGGDTPKINHDSFMDYEIDANINLADKDCDQQCQVIQGLWTKHHGHIDNALKNQVKVLFDSSHDPYLSAIYLMVNSHDFKRSTPKSLAFFIIDYLECWLKEMKCLTGKVCSISQETKIKALWTLSKHKNIKLLDKVVTVFDASNQSEEFVAVIKALVNKNDFAAACRLAISLKLFDFSKEDFVLPLLIQDRHTLAESYLDHHKTMQQEVINFLDKHLNYPREMLPLISETPLPEIKYEKLNTKCMANLVNRLVLRFNLSNDICPNTTLRQKMSSLRYLIHKRYEENTSIEPTNWEELIILAVKDSCDLQTELIRGLCNYGDYDSAIKWTRKFSIPLDQLPFNLPSSCYMSKIQDSHNNIPPVDVWDVQAELIKDMQPKFYQPVTSDKIKIVSSEEELDGFCSYISNVDVVGIDVEWQPAFTRQLVKASILQVATAELIFIIDVSKLRGNVEFGNGQGKRLVHLLFANPNILKLGFSIREDFLVLSRSLPGFENLSGSLKNVLDIHSVWTYLKTHYESLLPKVKSDDLTKHKGLSGIVKELFDLPLDKREQFSDWERRPLRESQLIYAAVDAYCLIQIFETLKKRSETFGMDTTEIATIFSQSVQSTRSKDLGKVPRELTTSSMPSSAKKLDGEKHALSFRPSEIRFVCDTMLHRLGKLLRSCGIDTALASVTKNPTGDSCILIAMNENRIGLSRGKPYSKLCKFVGTARCHRITSDQPVLQIQDVLRHFNILIEENDIFTRCQVCNCNSFHRLHQHQMKLLKSNLPLVPQMVRTNTFAQPENRRWTIVDIEDGHMKSRTTSKGVEIQVELVPEGVIAIHEYFYVCVNCGKCYWGGSHFQKALKGSLKNVLNYKRADSLHSVPEMPSISSHKGVL